MSHNHETTAVGQVWEDRKGNRREVLAIEYKGKTYNSVAEVPVGNFGGRPYDLTWCRPVGNRVPRTIWCSTWDAWVNHATLVQEDS